MTLHRPVFLAVTFPVVPADIEPWSRRVIALSRYAVSLDLDPCGFHANATLGNYNPFGGNQKREVVLAAGDLEAGVTARCEGPFWAVMNDDGTMADDCARWYHIWSDITGHNHGAVTLPWSKWEAKFNTTGGQDVRHQR